MVVGWSVGGHGDVMGWASGSFFKGLTGDSRGVARGERRERRRPPAPAPPEPPRGQDGRLVPGISPVFSGGWQAA